jgi:hypothetical protein
LLGNQQERQTLMGDQTKEASVILTSAMSSVMLALRTSWRSNCCIHILNY